MSSNSNLWNCGRCGRTARLSWPSTYRIAFTHRVRCSDWLVVVIVWDFCKVSYFKKCTFANRRVSVRSHCDYAVKVIEKEFIHISTAVWERKIRSIAADRTHLKTAWANFIDKLGGAAAHGYFACVFGCNRKDFMLHNGSFKKWENSLSYSCTVFSNFI